MCEGASKQFSDPKNSTTPGPRPPVFEIPGSTTAIQRISYLSIRQLFVCDQHVHIPLREKEC